MLSLQVLTVEDKLASYEVYIEVSTNPYITQSTFNNLSPNSKN